MDLNLKRTASIGYDPDERGGSSAKRSYIQDHPLPLPAHSNYASYGYQSPWTSTPAHFAPPTTQPSFLQYPTRQISGLGSPIEPAPPPPAAIRAAPTTTPNHVDIPTTLLQIELSLVQKLKPILIPPPVSYVYSPLEYAYESHANYVYKYCTGAKRVLFVGMNPGPWGMSQTGVPFGEVNLVRSWLKVEGRIGKPLLEHPSRLVEGFNCPRSEVSGQRFWSYWKDLCREPETFFRHCFVYNYCPLAFMKDSGRNVTPPELKSRERTALFTACDEALIQVIRLLQVELIIGVGKFPQQRTQLALQSAGLVNTVRVESILHPSPVNPTANKGWRDVVHRQLGDLGLLPWLMATGRE